MARRKEKGLLAHIEDRAGECRSLASALHDYADSLGWRRKAEQKALLGYEGWLLSIAESLELAVDDYRDDHSRLRTFLRGALASLHLVGSSLGIASGVVAITDHFEDAPEAILQCAEKLANGAAETTDFLDQSETRNANVNISSPVEARADVDGPTPTGDAQGEDETGEAPGTEPGESQGWEGSTATVGVAPASGEFQDWGVENPDEAPWADSVRNRLAADQPEASDEPTISTASGSVSEAHSDVGEVRSEPTIVSASGPGSEAHSAVGEVGATDGQDTAEAYGTVTDSDPTVRATPGDVAVAKDDETGPSEESRTSPSRPDQRHGVDDL